MTVNHLDITAGVEREWLVSSLSGHYASSTVFGINTRRHHGLLVHTANPPTDRTLLVSSLNEEVAVDGVPFKLSPPVQSHRLTVPEFFVSFSLMPVPSFRYLLNGVVLTKSVAVSVESSATVVKYKIENPSRKRVSFAFRPLTTSRNIHSPARYKGFGFKVSIEKETLLVEPDDFLPFALKFPQNFRISPLRQVVDGVRHPRDEEDGYHFKEMLFIPAVAEAEFSDSVEFAVVLLVGEFNEDFDSIVEKRKKLYDSIVESAGFSEFDDWQKTAVSSTSHFIVKRKTPDSYTIIAGYPHFEDWGRDAMISLEGVLLIPKRFEEAKSVLRAFASYEKKGLIPNTFSSAGGVPYYNTIDASLWFIYALGRYVKRTGDFKFAEEVKPVVESIIYHYINGTDFGIKMDDDGLVKGGSSETQLTWMDIKIGDEAVTPRYGKCVEINALWYNALMVYREIYGREFSVGLADLVRRSFNEKFWNEEKSYLNDVVYDDCVDDSMRPNQVISASLDYPVVSRDMASKFLGAVIDNLFTPFGLRTLSPDSPDYRGKYAGDLESRDRAYHQGTVWMWLLEHFARAYIYAFGVEEFRRVFGNLLMSSFESHIRQYGVGCFSEVFDGDYPHLAGGCFHQAWSTSAVVVICEMMKR